VKLSNINRSLNEQQSLIKTEDRLSRNLDDMDFTDGMNHQIGRLGASKMREKMVIAYIEVRNEVLLVLTVRFCRGMRGTEPEVEDPIGADLLGI
jgi:hypothetical protein